MLPESERRGGKLSMLCPTSARTVRQSALCAAQLSSLTIDEDVIRGQSSVFGMLVGCKGLGCRAVCEANDATHGGDCSCTLRTRAAAAAERLAAETSPIDSRRK
jgi:flavoprotein